MDDDSHNIGRRYATRRVVSMTEVRPATVEIINEGGVGDGHVIMDVMVPLPPDVGGRTPNDLRTEGPLYIVPPFPIPTSTATVTVAPSPGEGRSVIVPSSSTTTTPTVRLVELPRTVVTPAPGLRRISRQLTTTTPASLRARRGPRAQPSQPRDIAAGDLDPFRALMLGRAGRGRFHRYRLHTESDSSTSNEEESARLAAHGDVLIISELVQPFIDVEVTEVVPPPMARSTTASTSTSANDNGENNAANNKQIWLPLCNKIWNEVYAKDDAVYFREPVDYVTHPDYLLSIEDPIDLGIVKNKLQVGDYNTLLQFHFDMELIFNNCKEFFHEDSAIYASACSLQRFYECRMNPVLKSFGYCSMTKRVLPDSVVVAQKRPSATAPNGLDSSAPCVSCGTPAPPKARRLLESFDGEDMEGAAFTPMLTSTQEDYSKDNGKPRSSCKNGNYQMEDDDDEYCRTCEMKPTSRKLTVFNAIKCTICFDFPASPIRHCKNGHIICGFCFDRMPAGQCSTCKAGGIQNSILGERLAKQIEHKSKCYYFSDIGCKQVTDSTKMMDHVQTKCYFRNIVCQCSDVDVRTDWSSSSPLICKESVKFDKFNEHLGAKHNCSVNRPPSTISLFSMSYSTRFLKKDGVFPCTTLKFEGLTFMWHRQFRKGIFYSWVTVLGDKLDAAKYCYELKFVQRKNDLKHVKCGWELPVLAFHDHPQLNKPSPFYATMPVSTIVEYSTKDAPTDPARHTFSFSVHLKFTPLAENP